MWAKDWTWEPPLSVGLRPPGSHWSTTGLVGFWGFREGAGLTAYDGSGNGNHGTLVNGPAWTSAKPGRALSFDGNDDYVTVPDSSTLEGMTEFTLIIWHRCDQTPSAAGRDFDLYQKATAHASGEPIVVWADKAAVDHYAFLITDAAGHTTGAEYSTAVVAASVWTMFALTFVGDLESRIYIDGQWDSTHTHASVSDVAVGIRPVTIGIDRRSGSYEDKQFDGQIARIALYSRALSAAEVAYLSAFPNIVYQPRPWRAWMVSVAEGLSIPVAMRYYRNRRVA